MTINDTRGPDARRDLADELARLLATGDGQRTAQLLDLLGVTARSVEGAEGGDAGSAPADAHGGGPRPIGIYRPAEKNGSPGFERPPIGPFGDHHAARLRIEAEKPRGTRRVVFFGESAAAGYLLAPTYTPAIALQGHLDRSTGTGRFEVVDLARTNERLATLRRTVDAARQLSPDVAVLFAGNNWNLLETPAWSCQAPAPDHRRRFGRALAGGGLGRVVREAERALRRRVQRTMAGVARSLRGCRVILVVPEVNLADWSQVQPVPWLSGDRLAHWWSAYRAAVEALDEGRFGAAAEDARRLLAIEADAAPDVAGCFGPTAHQVLGQALLGMGDPAGARGAFRDAVDAEPYATLAGLGAPRATRLARQLLHEAAEEHDFTVVDLSLLFARHGEESVAGRGLFLDYCHLTPEGIHLAMAGVASAVVGGEKGAADVAPMLEASPSPRVPPPVRALACLGAAVHTAHRLAPRAPGALLRSWCWAALDADPSIVRAMADLVSVRAGPLPPVLHEAQGRNDASPHRMGLQHGWRWPYLDLDVLRAAKAVAGAEVADPDEAIVRSLAVGTSARELVRPPYLLEPLAAFFADAIAPPEAPGRLALRTPWPHTVVALVIEQPAPIVLQLTARLPPVPGRAERTGTVALRLGERRLASLVLDARFRTHRVHVERAWLGRGVHRLTLDWPMPDVGESDPLTHVADALQRGHEAEIHPVFGEVASLTARLDPVDASEPSRHAQPIE